MFSKRPLPFPEFLANLQTFDVVLMHGLFASSLSIEIVEGCDWSHSAMVLVAKDIGITGVDPETRLLWESNVLDIPEDAKRVTPVLDVILNTPKDGPQLVKLSDRISHNLTTNDDSDVGARKLFMGRTPDMYASINKIIQSVHPCHFPKSPTGDPGDGEMENFIIGRFKNIAATDNTFFCSQLLAHTFKAMGMLTMNYPDNSYAPVDFSEALDVSFLNGAWLGREIMLDTKTVPPYPLKSA